MTNFEKSIKSFKEFQSDLDKLEDLTDLKRAKIDFINTPLLQTPSLTESSTTDKMRDKYGVWVDYATSSYYILQRMFTDNNWVSLATDTIASVATNCEPNFVFESKKKTRNATLIDNLTEKLEYPNNNETWHRLAFTTYQSLVLLGNAYWQIVPTIGGGIYGIYSVPAHSIRPIPYIDEESGDLRFVYAQVGTNDGVNYHVKRAFDDTEIIHFKRNNPFSIVHGMSAFSPLFSNLSFDIQTKVWLNNYLKNAYSGGMIFEMKSSHKDIVARNKEQLMEVLSGSRNAGRNMILEGEIRLVHDGNKAKDFPMSELSAINSDHIMICAGVPLSMAGLRSEHGNMNGESVEAEEQAFLRNTIEVYQKIVFETLNLHLLRNQLNVKDLKIKAGVNRHFSFKRAESMVETAMKVGGTINEFRKILGMPKLVDSDYGEKIIIATNNGSIPLDEYFNGISDRRELELEQMKVNLETAKSQSNVNVNTDIPEETTPSIDQNSIKVSPKAGKVSLE